MIGKVIQRTIPHMFRRGKCADNKKIIVEQSRSLFSCVVICTLFTLFYIFRRQLIYCVEKQLLSEHKSLLLQKGLDSLLDQNRRHDLSLLYNLFSRIKGGLEDLCTQFNAYIKVR